MYIAFLLLASFHCVYWVKTRIVGVVGRTHRVKDNVHKCHDQVVSYLCIASKYCIDDTFTYKSKLWHWKSDASAVNHLLVSARKNDCLILWVQRIRLLKDWRNPSLQTRETVVIKLSLLDKLFRRYHAWKIYTLHLTWMDFGLLRTSFFFSSFLLPY